MTIIIPIIAVTGIGLLVRRHVVGGLQRHGGKGGRTGWRRSGSVCRAQTAGSCGYTGCDGYAKAVVEQGAKTNLCIPGATATSQAIATSWAWKPRK